MSAPISLILDFVLGLLNRGASIVFTEDRFSIRHIAITERERIMCDMLSAEIVALRPLIELVLERYEHDASEVHFQHSTRSVVKINGLNDEGEL